MFPRKRFQFFCVPNNRMLPPDHPAYTPSNKIKPVMDILINLPGENFSIDESLVGSMGKQLVNLSYTCIV